MLFDAIWSVCPWSLTGVSDVVSGKTQSRDRPFLIAEPLSHRLRFSPTTVRAR